MQRISQRMVELDFFRGLVLLIILVDHIGGSMLSRITLHAYAMCDAAEAFVFLGGFATATAYLALTERHTENAASRRFMWRALTLYRAFLVTAALMLMLSAVLRVWHIDAPNLANHDLDSLLATPSAVLRDILLLRRQPYLASVLPMYALFALAVPLMLPLARRAPYWLLAASIALWMAAPWLARYLPGASPWNFNPFAWQLLFVGGALVRCQPIYQRASGQPAMLRPAPGQRAPNTHRYGALLTLLALSITLGAAYYNLRIDGSATEGALKRNLAWPRVLNFIALAWLAANLVRHGWVRRLAVRLPWVGEIGRNGLVCFIAGAAISLLVDSVLYATTNGLLDVTLGCVADVSAIAALVLVAKIWPPLTRGMTRGWGAKAV